ETAAPRGDGQPGGSSAGHRESTRVDGRGARGLMDLLRGVGILLMAGAIFGLVMLATRPPRCRECGVLATHVDEYDVSAAPRVLARRSRCPRLGAADRGRADGVAGEGRARKTAEVWGGGQNSQNDGRRPRSVCAPPSRTVASEPGSRCWTVDPG